MPESFPTDHSESPANPGFNGGGGNRTRAAFPTHFGVIYVVQAVGGGPVKIGYCDTRDRVRKRLRGIQTGNPHKLRIVHLEDGPRSREWDLHQQFRRHRLVGEWFTPVWEIAERFPDVQFEHAATRPLDAMYDAGYEDGWHRGYDDGTPCERCGERALCECPETTADKVRQERVETSMLRQRYVALHGSTRGIGSKR